MPAAKRQLNTLSSIKINNKWLNCYAQMSSLFKFIRNMNEWVEGCSRAWPYCCCSCWCCCSIYLPPVIYVQNFHVSVDFLTSSNYWQIDKLAKNMFCNMLSSIKINNKWLNCHAQMSSLFKFILNLNAKRFHLFLWWWHRATAVLCCGWKVADRYWSRGS